MMFAKFLFCMCIGVLINAALVESDVVNDELHKLIRKMQQEIDSLKAKDDIIEADLAKSEDSIEERVSKLEQLSRIGTLRSCAEYARFVINMFLVFYFIFPPIF